jgi:hypothetical protein
MRIRISNTELQETIKTGARLKASLPKLQSADTHTELDYDNLRKLSPLSLCKEFLINWTICKEAVKNVNSSEGMMQKEDNQAKLPSNINIYSVTKN